MRRCHGTRPQVAAPAGSHARATVVVLAWCGATVPLVSILPVPLLPELPAVFHTSLPTVSWALTATLLAAAVCTPVAGRAGDLYGKRLVLVASLGALMAGSLVCGLADSVAVLVAGRALQGCAAGALPLSFGILRDEVGQDRLASALAAMSAAVGATGAAGFPLAAFVAHSAGWRVLFFLAAALGVTELVLVLAVVPVSSGSQRGRFDVSGAAALTVGLVCLLVTVTNGGGWGWETDRTLAVAGASVAGLAVWWRIEIRVSDPLVDLRTTLTRPVLAANVAAFLVGFAMYAMSVIIPELLEAPARSGYGAGMSVAATGVCLAPSGVAMMLLSPISARVSARWGPSATLAGGAAAIGGAYAAGALLFRGAGPIIAVAFVVGAGLAFTFAAMPALVLAAVPSSQSAAAGGMNILIRSVGAAAASAAFGTVLGTMTTTISVAGAGVTLPSRAAFRVAFLVAGGAALAGAAVAAVPVQRGQAAASWRSSPSSSP
jgi:predicted MFS family arabinose efflux permease